MTTLNAKGSNGTITFDGRLISIERSGFLARSTQGRSTKVIPLSSVQAVQWRRAGMGTRGYLELTIAGGIEHRSRPGGLQSQNMDNENAIAFSKRQQADVRAVYEAIIAAQSAAL